MRETVAVETPLAFAISAMVIFLSFDRFFTNGIPSLPKDE
jgi:hypothetical protein